jgi:hypothetical protein
MRGIHRKRFRGTIATIERPDLELDVELWVEERALTVSLKDKPLGSWPIELVEIDRVGSARFVITLDGEHSAFIARDPIAFSYEGLKAITTAKDKGRKRRVNRRKHPVPSLKAILVARVQGLQEPAPPPATEKIQPVPPPASADAPPPRSTLQAAVIAEPAVVVQPADPYSPEPELVSEPEPEPEPAAVQVPEPESEPVAPAYVAPATRRHQGVLDKVRAARNATVHEHLYTQHAVAAGLVRKVCNECGHVSIDISE